jgi:hypothetical protein
MQRVLYVCRNLSHPLNRSCNAGAIHKRHCGGRHVRFDTLYKHIGLWSGFVTHPTKILDFYPRVRRGHRDLRPLRATHPIAMFLVKSALSVTAPLRSDGLPCLPVPENMIRQMQSPLQQSNSREIALAAIAEAHGELGQAATELAQSAQPEEVRDEMFDLLKAHSANLAAKAWRSMLTSRSFVGLLALVCIGIAIAAWQSSRGQVAPDPISTSSISIKKKEELSTRPASTNSDIAAKTNATEHLVQTPPQSAAIIPMASPTDPELSQRIQLIARELENVGQGIDQLKTEQSQVIHENAELAEQIKAAQEIARHNADLIADLKAAQAQTARDNANLASQIKAGQDLMANIAEQLKQRQEQAASLAASEQKLRPKTRTASTPTIANSTRKPVATPPSPKGGMQTQTQASRPVQPKQQ